MNIFNFFKKKTAVKRDDYWDWYASTKTEAVRKLPKKIRKNKNV
jgi:hypothetical protein